MLYPTELRAHGGPHQFAHFRFAASHIRATYREVRLAKCAPGAPKLVETGAVL